MSDALKWELAQELGVEDIVAREGWGGVSARNCGNLVKLAVMHAEEALARDYAEGRSRGRMAYGTGQSLGTEPAWGGGPGGRNMAAQPYAARVGGNEPFPYWVVEREPGPGELRS